MGGCKQTLSGRDFRPCCHQHIAGNPNNTLIGADARARRHGRNHFRRHVHTDRCKVTIGQLQKLRAMVARFTKIGVISAEAFDKHGKSIIIMICVVKPCFDYSKGMGKESEIFRKAVCAEVVRFLVAERKRLGISGNALAEKSGLSQSLISSLETNPWNPTLDTLLRITDVLGIDLGDVIKKARVTVQAKQSH